MCYSIPSKGGEAQGRPHTRREHEMKTNPETITAKAILANVERRIEQGQTLRIVKVCDELSIFDWWNENLSLSQLKAMRSFLKQAIKMGYDGYVCFKVGAAYCSSGMWAYKALSTDGYSPKGEFVYRSFYSGKNYWDAQLADGTLVSDKAEDGFDSIKTPSQLVKAMQA